MTSDDPKKIQSATWARRVEVMQPKKTISPAPDEAEPDLDFVRFVLAPVSDEGAS